MGVRRDMSWNLLAKEPRIPRGIVIKA